MPELRADRIATLYFVHPLQRLLRRVSTGVPILMYHSISANIEVHRSAYFHTCTDPQVFREHIAFLARNGYRAIGLGEAVRRLEDDIDTGEKQVVLTFDDGFEDFYTDAFPILSTHGYTATVFLPTAFIGNTSRRFNGTSCLTWSQVRELRGAGIEFGSHTVTHPQLRTLRTVDIQRELRSSKEQIEEQLGGLAASFSYPYAFPEEDGAFRQRLRDMLAESGYENGVSTIIGTTGRCDDRFLMRRLPLNSSDDLRLLGAKLDGGYDWLHGLQYAAKVTRRNRLKLRDGNRPVRF
jgi:peptidoglycan/xylan/chitin deacetylase (PgdA/CDA1 family)